jgi:hypothetical protein
LAEYKAKSKAEDLIRHAIRNVKRTTDHTPDIRRRIRTYTAAQPLASHEILQSRDR